MPCVKKENELLLFAVGGPRGVGKTTVLKHLVFHHSDLSAIYISNELRVYCDQQLGRNFFELPVEEKDLVRKQHGEQLIARLSHKSGTFLLDLHYIDVTEGAEKIIQPEVILQHISVFALLDASNSVISERISGQEPLGRVRSISHIEKERNAELRAAKRLANQYEQPYLYLDTTDLIEDVAIGLYGLLQTCQKHKIKSARFNV